MKNFEKNRTKKSIIGMNTIEAGSIKLIFKNNNIKNITCLNQIESDYIEIDLNNPIPITKQLLFLDGFTLINRLSK